MCDAMNRDIVSVILGGYGTKASGKGEAMKFEGEATTTNVDDVVKQLMESQSVIIVPGYGLAVAQAQFAVVSLQLRKVDCRSGLVCRRVGIVYWCSC